MAQSLSSSADSTPPWLELPREITSAILHKLGAVEILATAQKVCPTWRSACQDASMWRCIDMRNWGNHWEIPYDLEEMCRHAVDRSQGQLIDINIEDFGTDDLLLYISQRSSQLRRLQLVYSYKITGKGVIEAVKKFPLLEELHLYYTSINAEAIATVGRLCPKLKSFKLNSHWCKGLHVLSDSEALAIAESMPGLQHLQLFGNQMTNEGLQAILDGCPNLVSLDLRHCFNVHLCANLGKACCQRIKDLRRPHDSTDDYQFCAEIYDYETSDDDYLTGYSDVDMFSDYEDYLEFSRGSASEFGDYDYDPNDYMYMDPQDNEGFL